MNRLFCIAIYLLASCTSGSQYPSARSTSTQKNAHRLVGGGCDGCELMYTGMPKVIGSTDTSAGWYEDGQRLLVTGTVYQIDGKTPAPEVIIYYWQTNNKGYYAPVPDMDEKAKRHGHIRGWVKTDQSGKYAIYTVRPAPYPNKSMPAHIHISLKEPTIPQEYYIDEWVFDDDPLLTGEKRKALENRGGSGILRVLMDDTLQIAEHNIILGLNIPNYPDSSGDSRPAGLAVGEDQPSFTPFHAFGADKGKRTCPVCKYGRYHGILYFVGNNPQWDDIRKWLVFLDKESRKRQNKLKVYFIYGNEYGYSHQVRRNELKVIGTSMHLQQVALTYVPSLVDITTDVYLNKVNPSVQNTFVVYKNRNIIAKYTNWKPVIANYETLSGLLNNTQGNYFHLPGPVHQ